MRKLAIALLVTYAPASSARAQSTSYTNIPRQYSTDEVMSVLGKSTKPTPGQPKLLSGEVHAGIHTSVNCGALRVKFDIGGMIDGAKKIPKLLAAQAQSLINGLPMLVLCQASPSLCAEIKNLNYQINEELKGLTDICRTMDSFIDEQARIGKAQGWQACVRKRQDEGMRDADAQKACNESGTNSKFRDIKKGWVQDQSVDNVLTEQQQQILSAMLQAPLIATGQNASKGVDETKYQFLSAMLGELTLLENGESIAVRPAQLLTAADLAKTVGSAAIDLACGAQLEQGARGQLPKSQDASVASFWHNHMIDIVKEKIHPNDVVNLWALDEPDRNAACNALGRALARDTLDRLADDGETTMAQVLENPALTSGGLQEIRKNYEWRARSVFAAIRAQRFEGSQHKIEDLRKIIQAMAESLRETNRRTGAAISTGQMRMNAEMSTTHCEGAYTCGK